jgi:hypothetical protein
MFDLVYDFIIDTLLASVDHTAHTYYEELAMVMTHVTMWLFYVVLVILTIHLFNSFKSMTRFW